MIPSLSPLWILVAVLAPPVDPSMPWTAEIVPGEPISAGTPWAIAPDDGPRTHFEALYGKGVDPTTLVPIRDGNLVYDGESLGLSALAAQGLPLPSLDHDPTPGILYVEMEGVTLKPTCYGGQTANAALNCSPLVDSQTVFPPLGGGAAARATVMQELGQFYAAFNLVLTTARPPDYLPYSMAVIGGTSGNAGQQNGVCGIANVACDGAKRNHVSLTFPQSCVGQSAEIAAQESAHNFGLEHTDVQSDLMYPYVAGAGQFRDECMAISHATGSGITQCTYVHEFYCPAGQGEEQNSYGELMGVFGPREVDDQAPVITEITPADGTVFTTDDTFTPQAKVTDNLNFVGVKWTWLEGLPPDFQDTGYTRCTNGVCTDDYPAWGGVEGPWQFLTFTKPPAGTYKFKFEVMDAYGNQDSKTISVTVNPAQGSTTGDPGTTGNQTTDPTAGTDATTGADPTGGADATGGTDPTGGPVVTTVDSATTGGMDGDDSCNCRADSRPSLALLLLFALAPRRRRRSAGA